jgi:hypothetical protein
MNSGRVSTVELRPCVRRTSAGVPRSRGDRALSHRRWHRTAAASYDRRMKLFVMILLFTMMMSLGGCLIRTHSRGRGYRSCPPAHHWDGYACVHNGRGHGKVRDHRR